MHSRPQLSLFDDTQTHASVAICCGKIRNFTNTKLFKKEDRMKVMRTTGRRTKEKEKNKISIWGEKTDSKPFGIVEKTLFWEQSNMI
jgi:hypothetical protein